MGVYKYDATNDRLIPIAGTSASGIEDKVSTYTSDSSYWDTSPTDASTKAITSGGVYDALQGISTADNFIGTLAEWNALSPTEQAEYKTKDIVDDFNGLPIDATPTQNSVNPVQSGGTYTALTNKLNTYSADATQWDATPTYASTKPVTSDGLYTAFSDKEPKHTILTQTLASGATSVTFTNAEITSSALIRIFTSKAGLNYTSINDSTSGTLIINYPAQSSSTTIKLDIRG